MTNLIVCVALRRSGTTQLFRAFRQTEFYCLDEPFNPKLRDLPQAHMKQIWAEFIAKYQVNPDAFRQRFEPTSPSDEISNELTEKQGDYLQWLVDGHDRVFFDTTRCQFKLHALQRRFPQATIVHLHRSPENFASSHLLPRRSGQRIADRLHCFRDRLDFFQRASRFDSWGMEQIVNAIGNSMGGEIGKLFGKLKHQPAFIKLMAYWWVVFQQVESVGRSKFGDRFISLPFGSFCDAPQQTVNRLLGVASSPACEIDCSSIHRESSPFRPGSPKWPEARELIGIPHELKDDRVLCCSR